MATIAGNFINASPIGDFTIFFLALDAQLILSDGATTRELPLRKLYKGYKILDKQSGEHIEKIWFELPDKNTFFHFEKVSKRTHLDIASVNSAIRLKMNGDVIAEAIEVMKTEISPISDARGTKEYKTLLLGQLIKAHFIGLSAKAVFKTPVH